MALIATDSGNYQAIADALRAETGEKTTYKPAEMAAAIRALGAGRSEVNFLDYDGTILHSYTVQQAAALTELPQLPSHDGLICQGWNWTLEDIQALGRAVDVGAMYITDDGKSRLHIRIADVARSDVPLYISQTVDGGVTIDWGDGSAAETLSGAGSVNTTHKYAATGDYTITLDPADGCELGFGDGGSKNCIMGSTATTGRVYANILQSVRIGRGVTSIGYQAFERCSSLASVTIPDSVTSIGLCAFFCCFPLSSVTIPDGVTSIGNQTFGCCYALAGAAVPGSVTSIGSQAFHYCYSLTSVTIPDGVTSIGNQAFYDCYSLTNVTIPDSATSIGTNMFIDCASLASVTLPGGLTSIEGATFSGCISLASVAIPDSVTSIGATAFKSCSRLASVTIPDGVTSIGDQAFYNNYCLASVTIPDSVTSIGSKAFLSCVSVAEYHLKPTTPPELGSNAFAGLSSDCIIYVPKGCLEAYQTATNWSTYADQMQEEP